MADRYQDRPYPSDDLSRGGDQRGLAENDPLAELARLIGQTDPFGGQQPAQQRQAPQPYFAETHAPEHYQDDHEELQQAPPAPPAWIRRANVQPPREALPSDDAPMLNPVHPLQRYAARQTVPDHEPQYQHEESYAEQSYAQEAATVDPSRYDDALYGQIESGEHDLQRDAAYPDDPYAYQNEYAEDEPSEGSHQRKRGGVMTVAAILALAVVGTGGAFAYKTYMGSPRTGEPPIIKADNTPTKVIPAPTDGSVKVPDRLASGDGGEKIVPREEAPVDINAKAGAPRVVFPALNPNANPPSTASVSPSAPPPPSAGPIPSNGTMTNSEPRRIRTLSVKGDEGAPAPTAPAKPAPAPKPAAAASSSRSPAASANASANQPLSLAPQSGTPDAPTRVATTAPTQIVSPPASEGGSYMVSISSQDSESAARESFRVLQGKFPSALGSRSPVIKKVDLADNKVKYRAMVGPYKTRQEAVQFCTELKTAGGQCFIP